MSTLRYGQCRVNMVQDKFRHAEQKLPNWLTPNSTVMSSRPFWPSKFYPDRKRDVSPHQLSCWLNYWVLSLLVIRVRPMRTKQPRHIYYIGLCQSMRFHAGEGSNPLNNRILWRDFRLKRFQLIQSYRQKINGSQRTTIQHLHVNEMHNEQ